MITKTFKGVLALLLQYNTTTYKGVIKIKNTQNQDRYLMNFIGSSSYYPYSASYTMSFGANQASSGVYIGTGDTAVTEDDYKLASVITSGISAGSPAVTFALDGSGNPYLELVYALTNTTSSDITVKEIGFVQYLRASSTLNSTSSTSTYALLDRTVLSTPVTVPANDSAAIKYTLKTIIS